MDFTDIFSLVTDFYFHILFGMNQQIICVGLGKDGRDSFLQIVGVKVLLNWSLPILTILPLLVFKVRSMQRPQVGYFDG